MILHYLHISYILALSLTICDVVDNNGPKCRRAGAVENGFVRGSGFNLRERLCKGVLQGGSQD